MKNPFIPRITGNVISGEEMQNELFEQDFNNKEVIITSDYISYLLNEIGAWKLHKNPLTFEKPIINFKIGQQSFYSEIGSLIETKEGLSPKADIEFSTTTEEISKALESNNPKNALKISISSGETNIKLLASQTELFAKGYSNLYNDLK